jgi:TolB protein
MNIRRMLCLILIALAGFLICATRGSLAASDTPSIGSFEGHTDVGTVLHPGSADYDAGPRIYTVTGSGENMWFAKDDFQFVWKKMSDDNVSLTADISILGTQGDHHRKGVLMIRQSLDEDARYADVARHGDGLTSLQFRDEKGGTTHEVESSVSGPQRLRIDKRGDRFYMWTGGGSGQTLDFAGGSARVPLKAPFYVGIGVCAHNKDAVQRVAFANVGLTTSQNRPNVSPTLYSTLETITVASTDARVAYVAQEHVENPSWTADGNSLIFRVGNNTQQVPVKGGTPETSPVPADHDQQIPMDSTDAHSRLSPDGKQIAFLGSSSDVKDQVLLSVMTVAERTTRVLAKLQGGAGSLGAHPWSPDSKRLTFISYQSIE